MTNVFLHTHMICGYNPVKAFGNMHRQGNRFFYFSVNLVTDNASETLVARALPVHTVPR